MDGVWKVCPESGGPVQFSGFNGELVIVLNITYVIFVDSQLDILP